MHESAGKPAPLSKMSPKDEEKKYRGAYAICSSRDETDLK